MGVLGASSRRCSEGTAWPRRSCSPGSRRARRRHRRWPRSRLPRRLAGSCGVAMRLRRLLLRLLDAEFVRRVATLGGLALGGAVVPAIREVRFRHSAMILLAGYAVFGVIAARCEHRIALAVDFPSIVV